MDIENLLVAAFVHSIKERSKLSVSKINPFKVRSQENPCGAENIQSIFSLDDSCGGVGEGNNRVERKFRWVGTAIRSSLFIHQACQGNGKALRTLEHICARSGEGEDRMSDSF